MVFTLPLRLALIAILALALSTAPAPAAPATQVPAASSADTSLLKAADLEADAAILRRAYEQLHPGLYRYNTRPQMDQHFEALQTRLNHDQSLKDAYLAFSLFAAEVKCGHTYANFFNQDESVARPLFKSPTRVPFYFTWIDRHMVVTQDFTPDHSLPRGTRILEINGNSTASILTRLLAIARADGSNDAKRIGSLDVTGDSLYETFDIYFPLFFPQKTTAMQLTILKPGADHNAKVRVEALTYEERIAPIKEREEARKGGDDVLFEWKYLPDGSAYLRMPTWALYDSKWDWKTWLNARLDELADKEVPAFLIDLRGNEGGLDIGDLILQRLVTDKVAITSLHRLVRYRQLPADLAPYLQTWDSSFKDWGKAAVDLPTPWPTAPPVPYLQLTKYDDDPAGDAILPAGKHYPGKVYVVVDATNSSATFQFAQIIQQQALGTLVGSPTGGSQRGINGGAFFFLHLPNSKIELDLPLIGTFPPAPMPDAGLTPDIPAIPTENDIAQSHDASLTAITRQIQKTANPDD